MAWGNFGVATGRWKSFMIGRLQTALNPPATTGDRAVGQIRLW